MCKNILMSIGDNLRRGYLTAQSGPESLFRNGLKFAECCRYTLDQNLFLNDSQNGSNLNVQRWNVPSSEKAIVFPRMDDLRMLIHINPEQGIDRSHLSVHTFVITFQLLFRLSLPMLPSVHSNFRRFMNFKVWNSNSESESLIFKKFFQSLNVSRNF